MLVGMKYNRQTTGKKKSKGNFKLKIVYFLWFDAIGILTGSLS